MKYHIWTIGCQYNEWDAIRLDTFMRKIGFTESDLEGADIIIIFACAVRQTAVDRIFGKLNRLSKSKQKLPKIIISGCVLEPDKKKLAQKGAVIVDSGDTAGLMKELKNIYFTKSKKCFATQSAGITIEQFNNSSKYMPIMSGCNNFCSYCAVPYTRGREKSRPIDEILAEAKNIIAKGHKEIMLLGQNVNSYAVGGKVKGKKPKGKTDFAVLLEELDKLDGDFEISFTSNHPKDMSDDIIEAIARLPKVKKEIHLPIQSGSDKILKAMNRPYTKKQYLKLVESIKLKVHKVKITTDVIVGFPGESEKDFLETVKIFKAVNYDVAYINKYSPRIGTAAYKLGDPIPWSEKQRRWHILNKMVANNPQTPE